MRGSAILRTTTSPLRSGSLSVTTISKSETPWPRIDLSVDSSRVGRRYVAMQNDTHGFGSPVDIDSATSEPSARPVRDVAIQVALVERPRRLLQHELRMTFGELCGRGRRVVPCPRRFATRDVMEILHAAVGRDDV